MAKEPNWHKQIAIGTWILLGVTLVLGLLQYLRPPDPAHPMEFDFLSKPLQLSPWFLFLIMLVVIIGTAAITTRRKRTISPVQPSPTPVEASPDLGRLFSVHPTSLDQRATSPQQKVNYTAKLRFSLENSSALPIRVLPPHWLTKPGNVSVQCGNPTYDGVAYTPGMVEFGHRYQLEDHPGSWQREKWRMKPGGEHDEHEEISVSPGQTFRIWIGLNPCVPHKDLEARRKTHRLGTVILPVVIGNQTHEWRTEV